jgi:hypothetical protein
MLLGAHACRKIGRDSAKVLGPEVRFIPRL